MENYQFFPKGGITNDTGCDLKETANFKMYLSEGVLGKTSVPHNCSDLVKQFFISQQKYQKCEPQKTKKLTEEEKAFPLEDSESFWTRLLKNKNNANEHCNTSTKSNTSYISFSAKECLENRYEV